MVGESLYLHGLNEVVGSSLTMGQNLSWPEQKILLGKQWFSQHELIILLTLGNIVTQKLPMNSPGERRGALPRECHSLTFFCNSGGHLPYIFL
jgi:hypothetical protein